MKGKNGMLYDKIKDNVRIVKGKLVNVMDILYRDICVGKGTIMYGKIKFMGCKKNTTIGENCILRSGSKTNPVGGGKIIFNIYSQAFLKIGNNVGISSSCFVASKGITIEDNVLIGGGSKFYDTDFHSVDIVDRMKSSNVGVKGREIRVKEGAWIGGHVIVLKGVTIGRNSVVGAGSVVTKDIPDNELWAGNPAKFIRKINQSEV